MQGTGCGSDPEEQQRTGRTSEDLSSADRVTGGDRSACQSAIRGPQARRVLDHHVPDAGNQPGETDNTPRSGTDGRARDHAVLEPPVAPAPEAPRGAEAVDDRSAHGRPETGGRRLACGSGRPERCPDDEEGRHEGAHG